FLMRGMLFDGTSFSYLTGNRGLSRFHSLTGTTPKNKPRRKPSFGAWAGLGFRASGERLLHPLGGHRQVAEPLAGELEDGIGDRRSHRHDPDLAHAGRRIIGGDDPGMDLRKIAHPQHRI